MRRHRRRPGPDWKHSEAGPKTSPATLRQSRSERSPTDTSTTAARRCPHRRLRPDNRDPGGQPMRTSTQRPAAGYQASAAGHPSTATVKPPATIDLSKQAEAFCKAAGIAAGASMPEEMARVARSVCSATPAPCRS